jgi:DNA replication protein DnaC
MKEYCDIELSENELTEAILNAKISKKNKLLYEENEILRKRKSDDLVKPFNADQLVDFCQRFYEERFYKKFEIDEDNKMLVELLSWYFTNDERFTETGRSLKKGILIMGNVGTGKTELMAFFQKNKKCCYTIRHCKKIAEEYLLYSKDSDFTIEGNYSTPIEKPLHDPSVFFQKYIGYCFDDLGTEENKNNYGNKKNVMADIVTSIYDKKDFSKFHMTTNLDKTELERILGTRVTSRMREMFNVFVYNGKDRRK